MTATWLWALAFIAGSSVSLDDATEERAQLLKTYRQIRRQFSEQEDVARFRLVRWCGDRGLWREMFEEADLVLDADPNHEETIQILEQVAAEAELESDRVSASPEARVRAFLKIIRDGRSKARAVVAASKIDTVPGPERREPLIKALGDRDTTVRMTAVRALGRLGGEDARFPLVRVQLADPVEDIRTAAFEAVEGLFSQDPDMIKPYLAALNSKMPSVRARAATALGALNAPAAIPAIIKSFAQSSSSRAPRQHIFVGSQQALVTDFDPEIAQSAIIADPIVSVVESGVLLDVAVLGVERQVTIEEIAVYRKVLPRLAGVDAGERASDWVAWWNGDGHKDIAARLAGTENG
ncbi:MAG: HEAT repeat domain-containing protein [Planctomycetota bacterium]